MKTVPSAEERTYLLLMVDETPFRLSKSPSVGTLPVLGFPTFERGPRWRLGRWAEMKFKMRSGRTNDDSLSSAGRPSASSVPENSRRVNTNRPSVFRPSPSPPPRPPRPPIPVLGRHRRRPRYYHRLRHLPPRRQGRQGSEGQHSLLSNLSAKLVHEVNTKRARGRIDSISVLVVRPSVRPAPPSLPVSSLGSQQQR